MSIFALQSSKVRINLLVMETKVGKIIELFKKFSDCDLYEKGYTRCEKNFLRKGKVSFEIVVYFLLNLPKLKLSLEILGFVKYFQCKIFTPSAFSQARYKVCHKYFIDLNKDLMKNIYSILGKEMKLWRGRRLISWDGTTQWVLLDSACAKEFGGQINQYGVTPLARAVHCYDVLNNFILESEIFHYQNAEETMVKQHLHNHLPSDIAIYDRRYTSWEFMYLHEKEGLTYVIRAQLDFNRYITHFVSSSKRSDIVRMKITGVALKHLQEAGYEVDENSYITVRMVKVQLDSGETEVLLTNLLDTKKYPKHVFGELYHYRWNDETGYDILKNKLQIEIFSGHKVEAVYQEFYAAMIAYNLHTLLTLPAQPLVEAMTKHRKMEYKINRNFAIGIIKNKLLSLFIDKNIIHILREMTHLFIKELIPIKPDRSEPRNFKKHKIYGKYYTSKNYRRAI